MGERGAGGRPLGIRQDRTVGVQAGLERLRPENSMLRARTGPLHPLAEGTAADEPVDRT